ncbi:helix-turn-helix transcriptional regulator [Streptomyces sp. TRM 70361]|uniref:helix-turn-helix domain-containing protein n=1 Tax=Streptomyces sp. TRM 70361 TaxID=3116553 RepID=UPI002E7B5775|nr:helix-turn-helix transcriptional regulator [Streptomyces sp. TRM 70361]MEE1938271.1 helix-turn-helix transcriptional regulator [Streptomyces sp. TRM 70361]
MGRPVTTVRRMRLGMELRRLREQAQVSQINAAEAIDGSDAKTSRVESGKTGLNRLELTALLDLYGVTDERFRSGLLELNRTSRQRGWWQQRSDIVNPQLQELIELESTASQIFEYEAIVIPGLFQTEEYAHAVISGFPPPHNPPIGQAVQIRLERQKLLERDDAPRIICILDEAVLHRQVGTPKTMAAQLRALKKVNNPPRLSIQVIPYTSGAHTGTDGSFRLFTYPAPADMDICFPEQKASRVFIEEETGLEPYRVAAEHLRTQALSSPESMRLIAGIAAEFDGKG